MLRSFVRRLIRRAAGLPPHGTPEPTIADVTALSERLNAMDKGLQDLVYSQREESQRTVARLRTELDAVIKLYAGSPPGAPAGRALASKEHTARSSSDS